MDDLIFKIIYCAATIMAAIIIRYVVPYINSKVDTDKMTKLESYIRYAISYAEKFVEGENKGEDKFATVTVLAEDFAKKYGLNISDEQIITLIQGIFNEVDGVLVNVDK